MISLKIPHEIINKYGIKLLILFGSTGTIYEREDSDLDIGFLTEKLTSIELEYEILEKMILFYKKDNIDLVNLRKATPSLKLEIAREGKVLYQQKGVFDEFTIYAARVYADTKIFRTDREKTLKERILLI